MRELFTFVHVQKMTVARHPFPVAECARHVPPQFFRAAGSPQLSERFLRAYRIDEPLSFVPYRSRVARPGEVPVQGRSDHVNNAPHRSGMSLATIGAQARAGPVYCAGLPEIIVIPYAIHAYEFLRRIPSVAQPVAPKDCPIAH